MMTPLCVCKHHKSAHFRKGVRGYRKPRQCQGWTQGKRCECLRFVRQEDE